MKLSNETETFALSSEIRKGELDRWPKPPENGWYAVAWSKDLKKEKLLAVQVLSKSYVLFRNIDGHVRVLADRCPHRLVPLSRGKCVDGSVQCPYHGWVFSEHGQLLKIPSFLKGEELPQVRISSFPVHEGSGIIWMSPSQDASLEDSARFPSGPEADTNALRFTTELEGEILFAIENFLDATHTHFVHKQLIRGDLERAQTEVHIQRDGFEVTADYGRQEISRGWITHLLAFGNRDIHTLGRFIYPTTGQLEYTSDRNWKMQIQVQFTPTCDKKMKAFVVVAYRPKLPKWIAYLLIFPLFHLAIRQDKWILKLQKAQLSKDSNQNVLSIRHDIMFPHILDLWRRNANTDQKHKSSRKMEMNL